MGWKIKKNGHLYLFARSPYSILHLLHLTEANSKGLPPVRNGPVVLAIDLLPIAERRTVNGAEENSISAAA